jgi:hypothetical protein
LSEIIKTTLIGLFFGTFGTTIGGLIGIKFKNPSHKFLSFILAFASGLMVAIVCFDLLPEAFELTNLGAVFLGILLGIGSMIFCDLLVDKKIKTKAKFQKNTLLKTGIIVSIGLALHNFPEGLAIGSGFGASLKLGLSLAIAICLHDIPERNIYGSTYEKWRNESIKSNFLCHFIRNNHRNRSIFWSVNRRNITNSNSYVFIICSRSNDLYCIRRTNTRI